MASRFACRLLAFLRLSWRVMLLAICLNFAGRLCWAEYQHAAGWRATTLQASLDGLTAAALAYPYQRRFRTGQAIQLFTMAKRVDGLIEPATISAENALALDPHSIELLSMVVALHAAQPVPAVPLLEDVVALGQVVDQVRAGDGTVQRQRLGLGVPASPSTDIPNPPDSKGTLAQPEESGHHRYLF